MKRLLVTGASGLLGLNLALKAAGSYHVIGTTHNHHLQTTSFESVSVDFSEPRAVETLFERCRPDQIIHCAAVANIDAAERDPQTAQRINAEIPGEIALAAHRYGARLVHLSTDAVFDGVRGDYSEEDLPNPLSVYARTKLAGEQAVTSANPQAVIARVNFYGWSLEGKRSLAEFFFNNLTAGRRVNGFRDVFYCPMVVDHLAEVLLALTEGGFFGIYHVVSRESLSKFEFARRIARQFGFDENLVKAVSVEEGGLAARRSPNLTLRVDKIERDLRLEMPDVDRGIAVFHAAYQAGFPQKLRGLLKQASEVS